MGHLKLNLCCVLSTLLTAQLGYIQVNLFEMIAYGWPNEETLLSNIEVNISAHLVSHITTKVSAYILHKYQSLLQVFKWISLIWVIFTYQRYNAILICISFQKWTSCMKQPTISTVIVTALLRNLPSQSLRCLRPFMPLR